LQCIDLQKAIFVVTHRPSSRRRVNCIRMWKDQIQSVGTMIVDAISRCWRSLTPLWDIRAVRLRFLRLESLLLASGSTGRILWLPTITVVSWANHKGQWGIIRCHLAQARENNRHFSVSGARPSCPVEVFRVTHWNRFFLFVSSIIIITITIIALPVEVSSSGSG
jgi:hypothetical protein